MKNLTKNNDCTINFPEVGNNMKKNLIKIIVYTINVPEAKMILDNTKFDTEAYKEIHRTKTKNITKLRESKSMTQNC